MASIIDFRNDKNGDHKRYKLSTNSKSYALKFVNAYTSKFTDWKVSHISNLYKCEGCEIDAPDQRSHMQCPRGCLHYPYSQECDGICEELPDFDI